jgi:hypothetical protein
MKKLLLAAAAVVAGLLFPAAPASAQTIASGFAFPSLRQDGTTVGGASGTFTVNISNVGGGMYQVQVTGNPDGNPPSGPAGTEFNGPEAATPKSGIGTISLNFFSGNQAVEGDEVSGFSTATNLPVQFTLGGPSNLPFGNTGGVFTSTPGQAATIRFTTGDRNAFVAPRGNNTFIGNFTLSNPNVTRVTFSLQDSGQQFNGQANIAVSAVPEPASISLALAGLTPFVGAVLRRRSRKSEASETESEEELLSL